MLLTLFGKECRQTAKSLIFYLILLILVFFYTSQMGALEPLQKPEQGETESYGMRPSDDPQAIMEATLGLLVTEYEANCYTAYPVGFYKEVVLTEEKQEKIHQILTDNDIQRRSCFLHTSADSGCQIRNNKFQHIHTHSCSHNIAVSDGICHSIHIISVYRIHMLNLNILTAFAGHNPYRIGMISVQSIYHCFRHIYKRYLVTRLGKQHSDKSPPDISGSIHHCSLFHSVSSPIFVTHTTYPDTHVQSASFPGK